LDLKRNDFFEQHLGFRGQCASACKILQKSVEYSNLSFFKIAVVRHLDLWGKFWDNPQQEFVGPYHHAKFGWDCVSRFDNTKT